MKNIFITAGLLLIFSCYTEALNAQRVLLIETLNSARTEKMYIGNYIQYRLVGNKQWFKGEIYDLLDSEQLLVFNDRYVDIAQIERMRFGQPWANSIGKMIATFGVSWSTFAVIGTATDGNPETNYRRSDALVTGISLGVGFLLPKLFGVRTLKFGKNRKTRLRVVDITF